MGNEVLMARNNPKSPDNIYRVCRLRGGYSSQKNASEAFDLVESKSEKASTSEGSLKDYERDAQIPSPETVLLMAQVYNTPELKHLHCANSCPIGEDLYQEAPKLAESDIYHTYFDLMGAFNRVAQIQAQLHEVISDDNLSSDELPTMDSILEVLDQIAESSREIRVWVEKQNAKAVR
jgi:hypothetical protein